jgi:hypothetical protein
VIAGTYTAYVVGWSLACAAALVLVARERSAFAFAQAEYWRFLAAPWKLATVAAPTAFFVLVAPYTGDPTWDRADALEMCVATYVTAPWALGTLVRVARRRAPRRQAFVAACAWLFAASWSYDGYLLWRDGRYPPTWWSNLIVSSFLYAAAGVLWNLAYEPGRGVRLAFLSETWPVRPQPGGTARVLAFGTLAMALVAALMSPFVIEVVRAVIR